eukprot:TRINITY_DN6798_c0_g1_i1.p1 TRINITY_DN6798_c0_g1~~TRINITY_DN6798_c0_g1_i1.p1  ORF type:complete len:607 (-),score=199.35 TRINITY_DN6798_c0_g1_i1:136-1956(-)
MKLFHKFVDNLKEPFEEPRARFLWLKFKFSRNFSPISPSISLNAIKLYDGNLNRIYVDYESVRNPGGTFEANENPQNLCGEGEEKWKDSNFRRQYSSILSLRFKLPGNFDRNSVIFYEFWSSDCRESNPVEWRVKSKRMSDIQWKLVDERRYVVPPLKHNSPYEKFMINMNYVSPLKPSNNSPIRFDPRIDPIQITNRSSVEIAREWEERREREGILNEYLRAKEKICIDWNLMKGSKMKTCVSLARELQRKRPISEGFHEVLKAAIEKVYVGIPFNEAKDSLDLNRILFTDIMNLYHRLDAQRKELMHLCLRELTKEEDSVGLIGVLNLLSRAGVTCQARQIQALYSLLLRFYSIQKKSNAKPTDLDKENVENARENVREFVEEWIELRKIRAFNRAFLEPCMAMMLAGGSQDEDVEVHGVNVFSALLSSTLGVETSVVPFLHDHIKGICTFLEPKSTKILLEEALKPSHLSKPFPKDLPSLDWMERIDLCPHSFLFGGTSPAAKAIAASHFDLSTHRDREIWGKHLEIFASFFSEEAVLEPLFVAMIGEEGPLNSLQMLFGEYKKGVEGIENEDLREWIYDSERNYEFDTRKARKFMKFLNIVS